MGIPPSIGGSIISGMPGVCQSKAEDSFAKSGLKQAAGGLVEQNIMLQNGILVQPAGFFALGIFQGQIGLGRLGVMKILLPNQG